jgi:hypothetical protein
MSIPVCTGGTVASGVTTITFTNSLTEEVEITSCTLPGWPTTPPEVPAASGGVNGTTNVILSTRTVVGTYSYTTLPACNTMGTDPQIKVQDAGKPKHR